MRTFEEYWAEINLPGPDHPNFKTYAAVYDAAKRAFQHGHTWGFTEGAIALDEKWTGDGWAAALAQTKKLIASGVLGFGDPLVVYMGGISNAEFEKNRA